MELNRPYISEVPVESGRLFVGPIEEAHTCDKTWIDHIVTVCQDDISENVGSNTDYSFYCMSDGPDNAYGGDSSFGLFASATDDVIASLLDGQTVLVHCHMGRSRSVSVASAAVATINNCLFRTALDSVKDARNVHSDPDELLIEHGQRYVETSAYSLS
jgi:hypothetical protein